MYDESGRRFLDFFSGAGSLNYGHNHPALKQALIGFIEGDRIAQPLDMWTRERRTFLETLDSVLLTPRQLDYRVQFPGPAGATAVEAALKLARKVTRRSSVIALAGGFHGMTLGARSLTQDLHQLYGQTVLPPRALIPHPYQEVVPGDSLSHFSDICRSADGCPAAIIVETLQGEGGVRPLGAQWLREASAICRQNEVLLIVDDIQMGCGRTGPFLSFEHTGIVPDIVCLSKSISGFGLPLSILLSKREIDGCWEPGEHSGTFRGFGMALLLAAESLRLFWTDTKLQTRTERRGESMGASLSELCRTFSPTVRDVRGVGLAWGVEFRDMQTARAVADEAARSGLLVETTGLDGRVVKLMPALTISDAELEEGLAILTECLARVAAVPASHPDSSARRMA
jgi:diaminobutyrate-2-oxoglutarate transaminase